MRKKKKKVKTKHLSRDYLRDRIVVSLLFSLSPKERKEFIRSLSKKKQRDILETLARVKK